MRRWIVGLVVVLVGVPVTLVLLNHAIFFYERLTSPQPGKGFVVPEASLPEDDAFTKLSAIAEPIHQPVSEDMKKSECEGPQSSFERCYGLLSGRADALQTLDQWLASPATYKLVRPVNLGWHVRDPVNPLTYVDDTPIPNYLAFGSLSRLLVARSMVFSQKGNVEGAIRDLETIFSLGSYLQQNPLTIGHAVGLAVQRRGLRLMVGHIASEELDDRMERFLPDPDVLRAEYRMVIGRDWMAAKNEASKFRSRWASRANDSIGGKSSGKTVEDYIEWFEFFGFYNSKDTLRLWSEVVYRPILNHLGSDRLGTSFFIPNRGSCDGNAWNPLFVIHNSIGRIGPCYAEPRYNLNKQTGYLGLVAGIGQTIDVIQATRIIFAARRYYRVQKRWPTQEAELVPAYLKTWPVSALDGQPLRWLDDRSGVVLLDEDGKTICKTKDCQFPFSMPQPLGPKKNTTDSSTSQVPPALPK